jgi:selenocysteine-specific elongation factor
LEVDEFTAGSFLEGAAKIAVSSVTGEGLRELRSELERTARRVQVKSAGGWFRLPIDRSFTMKGFGTVVTGTLISGALKPEQEVEVYPLARRLRVRGLHVYGEPTEHARAGERTALNLAGIEAGEIDRGMVLSEPGRFSPVRILDCRLEFLPSVKPLKNRSPVHFHTGSANVEAEIRYLAEAGWARVTLKEPMLVLPGDRFIIRRFSPVVTIGGGVVVDISAHAYVPGRLGALRPEHLVSEAPWGVSEDQLIAWTGLRDITALPGVEAAGKWLISRSRVVELRQQLVETCNKFHRDHSLLPGIPKQDLKTAVMADASAEIFDYVLAGAGELTQDGETVRMKTHRVVLKQDEAQARRAIESSFERAGLAAPAVSDVLKGSGVESGRARSILQMLLRERRLTRISDELVLHVSALAGLRELLALKRGSRFGVPMFKEWTGVSRKYAIPLLEYLDREHVTRREGDERVIL